MEEKRFGNLPEEVVEKEEVNRLRHRLILLSLKKTKTKQNKSNSSSPFAEGEAGAAIRRD